MLKELPSARTLIVTGLIIFLTGLIVQAPARLVAMSFPEGVSVTGISGSIWNGSASGLAIGQLRLYEANWTINPLYLFIGSVKASVSASGNDADFSGDIRASLTGNIELSDARGFAGLGRLKSVLDLPVNGVASIDIETLAYSGNWLDALVGNIEVRNLTFFDPMTRKDIELGNIQLTFDHPEVDDSGTLNGALKDADGPLSIEGDIRLDPPNSYALSADIRTRANADPALRQGLDMMAPPTGGVHQLRISSSF